MAGINILAGAAQKGSSNSAIRIVSDEAQMLHAKVTDEKNGTVQVTETDDATVQISDEARQKYIELEMLKQNAEKLREQREAGQEYAVDMAKIMEIFRRIARGDKVPPSDEKKLMEHSSELYQAAKSAAMLAQNKKRKEHKALFEEENELDRLSKAMMEKTSAEQPESAEVSFENVGVVTSE